MVTVAQGEIWWAALPDPVGSGPGYRRPVVVVQGDSLNRSQLPTVVCLPLTSNLTWTEAPGGTLLTSRSTGLSRSSVALATQVVTLDRSLFEARVGQLSVRRLAQVLHGIDVVLGR